MRAIKPNRGLGLTVALALTAVGAFGALAGVEIAMAAAKKVPLPKPRPAIHAAKETPKENPKKTSKETSKEPFKETLKEAVRQPAASVVRNLPLSHKRSPDVAGASAFAQANVGMRGAMFKSRALFKPLARPVSGPFSVAPTGATSADDIAAVKRAIEAAHK